METTPTAQSFHGTFQPRGLDATAGSSISTGRFGRMFRHLPSSSPDDRSLADLGRVMIQGPDPSGDFDKKLGEDDDDENTALLDGELRLPAGYTYFGQFVDHDITFDPVSSLTRQNDPDGLTDFRTPRFDLDSLYGRGPSDQPYLYEPDGVTLALGRDVTQPSGTAGHDLQRNKNDRALTGDPRNDENLIVSQLQATMIHFHNAVLKKVKEDLPHLSKEDQLKLAQQSVRWHYQWVVVHDFLPRLVGEEVIDDILPKPEYAVPGGKVHLPTPKFRFYHWRGEPFMPVEFSVAAYRYGHSVARPSYLINDTAKTSPAIPGVHRIRLFLQNGGELQSLNGFRKLPDFWTVQWSFFLPGIKDGVAIPGLPQPSYKLDAQLANPLGELPKSVAEKEQITTLSPGETQEENEKLAQDLAARNLFRGKRLGLPSGQDVSLAMGITPLTDAELFGGEDVEKLKQSTREDLAGRAPLWFYVLKESEVRMKSAQLGPVGGRIVAEVLIGLLDGDPLSFLGVQPNWTPTLPSAKQHHFTLSDLINFALH